MEITLSIINGISATITFGIIATWLYLVAYVVKSLKQTPLLDSFEKSTINKNIPKVSIILPARNEEKYIARCLDSLLKQDYPNFEIIAINDSSTDRTEVIMQHYAARDPRILVVNAKSKPVGWVGKNWACYQGYLRATGNLLLFTDADTVHLPSTMSLSVKHLIFENLDALTAIPKLLCKDFWTKITLPMLSTFLYSRFSALRVNDPKTKIGYFFGSFFIISRRTYEKVGTHKAVRHEIIEDGALGGKVKEEKFMMKMVRGDNYIEAIWARDFHTLWHGLRRLMIPLYNQKRKRASLMAIAIFFLLFEPFLLLPYSLLFLNITRDDIFSLILIVSDTMACAIIIFSSVIQLRLIVTQNPLYALASPLGGAIISLSFITSIIDARKKGTVSWRGRQYTLNEKQHPFN
ncbi:MAG: glycosyltransferase [Thermoproteota archaeon]|nr:glycosyltransferase [Thermoproteota archaeon]